MRKLLGVALVLALAALAGPAFAADPPVYVVGLSGTTQGVPAFITRLEPGDYYLFECPSYTTGCELTFGNGSEGTEVVWFTKEQHVYAYSAFLEMEAAELGVKTVGSGESVYYSIRTPPWSQEYPSNPMVDLLTIKYLLPSAATTQQPGRMVRAVPVQKKE